MYACIFEYSTFPCNILLNAQGFKRSFMVTNGLRGHSWLQRLVLTTKAKMWIVRIFRDTVKLQQRKCDDNTTNNKMESLKDNFIHNPSKKQKLISNVHSVVFFHSVLENDMCHCHFL